MNVLFILGLNQLTLVAMPSGKYVSSNYCACKTRGVWWYYSSRHVGPDDKTPTEFVLASTWEYN